VARIALFGLGAVAEKLHLEACASLPDVEVIAACDPDDRRRREMALRFALPRVYAEARELVAKERPEFVVIGAPPDAHRELCLLAIDHGAHVLCEKPFVASVAEADEVIAAADAKGRMVRVNNQYRFMNIYGAAHAALARGDFGRLYFVQCWQQMFHPPSMERNWRAHLLRSTLYEFGTHALDLICFFFGALPTAVDCHLPKVSPESAADVLVQVTLRFPQERLATLAFNRVSRAPMRYLEMRLDCEEASLRISFGGLARFSLEWSGVRRRPAFRFSLTRGGEARVESAGRSWVIARQGADARALATAVNLKALIDAASAGERSNEPARFARELLRVVSAAYESASSGRTVWLS